MYKNIGVKIKGLAYALCIIGAVVSIIMGVAYVLQGVLQSQDNAHLLIIIGVWTIIIGPLLSWLATWFIYGFGELIDKTSKIADGIKNND